MWFEVGIACRLYLEAVKLDNRNNRTGIILCAGEKTGKDKRFYDEMIPVADREFTAHLEDLKRGN